jgi:hypothetical protein
MFSLGALTFRAAAGPHRCIPIFHRESVAQIVTWEPSLELSSFLYGQKAYLQDEVQISSRADVRDAILPRILLKRRLIMPKL